MIMKILVPVKRVVDYNVKIKVKSDNSGVDLENTKMSINPFDEIAVEEAVRLKEKKICDEIIAISVGSAKSEETLRTALAVGVDKGILIETEEEVQPLEIAKILKEIIKKNNTDLVLMGKQAIDDDSNQTGQMLAALLSWPQGTFASKLEINRKKKSDRKKNMRSNRIWQSFMPLRARNAAAKRGCVKQSPVETWR